MEARPAATVVMVRQGQHSPELLFVRRPQSMKAFGGFHVFPGGTLDDSDATGLARELSILRATEASHPLGEPAGKDDLAYYVCAIRELFEEVGVLLAEREGRTAELTESDIETLRSRVERKGAFLEEMRSRDLMLATHRLKLHSRWLAPESLPIRFDVRVFLTESFGKVRPAPGEVESVEWLSADAALGKAEGGEIMLAPPTAATVTALAGYGTVAELLESAGKPVAGQTHTHSRLVRRIVAPNASVMTGPGSNTYVVGASEPFVVIDPGSIEPPHLRAVMSLGEIGMVIVTHGHPDHFSGAHDLASFTGAELVASKSFDRTQSPKSFTRRLGDGDVIDVGSTTLVSYETPGHSSDHLCLWLPEEKALFSADLVLGEGTTVISPPDGNMSDYLRSLHKVKKLGPERIYPGHFAPRDDAAEWIDFYIAHRIEREEQVLAALDAGAVSTAGMVDVVYKGYPPALRPIAERSVLAHLLKLIDEGQVVETDGEYRRA